LKEVGSEMGVTKERIRQIESRAMNKLRQAAAEEHIEIPE
jgi:RNA polymerase primary sigma factor